ncbi:MAG: aspartate--tRNA(Asn) ligase [Candidatus Bathyarchaeia archaeon]
MKLDKLGNWRRTHFSRELTPEMDGQTVILFGWVRDIRDLGGIKFIILGDREGTTQLTIKSTDAKLAEKVGSIKKEYVIGVKGVVRRNARSPRGFEIMPDEIRILNIAQHPLPLDPTGRIPADIDVRLDARILDLRRPSSHAIFKVFHHTTQAIREFLLKEGFLEVHTPKIIATATEGGAALFPIIYFEREAFLAQSPQLYKEQLTAALEKVFEIAPYFRAEESHTTRHISEFTSVDIEMSFSTIDDVTNLLERMIVHVVGAVKDACKEELAILNHEIKPPSTPIRRYTYDEILEELRRKDIVIPWGEDIPTPALRAVGENHPDEFYFIVDWPTKSKAFYIKPREDRPEISEGFDLMYSWVEVASGGSRIHDKDLLIQRMREQQLNPESFEYHLKVFDAGMPPHAGWGLGLNRLVMVLTGKDNIRECVLFPRDRFRLTP